MTRFRARSSVIYSSIVMGACAIIAIATLIGGGWYEARPALGFLAAIAAVAFAAYFRPSVDIYDDRAELVNIVTIAVVPFARLTSIETRWALELVADDASKATAFAAPAPGAMKARTVTANQAQWNPDIATLIYSGGPGTSTATASGTAAHLVDDAYRAWADSHAAATAAVPENPTSDTVASAPRDIPVETATASGKAISRRPNWLSIAVLAAGLALLVLSF
jgi:hypothetical protein